MAKRKHGCDIKTDSKCIQIPQVRNWKEIGKPFVPIRKIEGNFFHRRLDTGSLITIFKKEHQQSTVSRNLQSERQMKIIVVSASIKIEYNAWVRQL